MAGGWSSLPADLLRRVSACLTSDADHLHAHQVCAHWRTSTSRLAACRPWAVAGRQPPNGRGPLGEYSLLLPRSIQRVDFAAAPLGLPYCCGTPRGWLALADDLRSPTRLVLWEPHSGTEIPLPRLCPVVQIFLSGDPLASSHWMAVASQPGGTGSHILFFWRPGDAAWTGPGAAPTAPIHSVEFHAGNMYCVDSASTIVIYDLNLGTPSPPVLIQGSRMSPNGACKLSESWASRRSDRLIHSVRRAHVVACGGELLVVLLFRSRHPSFMEVYRPAWTPCWPFHVGERVTGIGGYALFLGRGDAVALPAKEFPAIRGNCIYYLVHCLNFSKKYWAFVFDLETDAVEDILYPEAHKEEDGRVIWWPYSWFCPQRPFLED